MHSGGLGFKPRLVHYLFLLFAFVVAAWLVLSRCLPVTHNHRPRKCSRAGSNFLRCLCRKKCRFPPEFHLSPRLASQRSLCWSTARRPMDAPRRSQRVRDRPIEPPISQPKKQRTEKQTKKQSQPAAPADLRCCLLSCGNPLTTDRQVVSVRAGNRPSEGAMLVNWGKGGRAEFHGECWAALLTACARRANKSDPTTLSPAEKRCVKEAAARAEYRDPHAGMCFVWSAFHSLQNSAASKGSQVG